MTTSERIPNTVTYNVNYRVRNTGTSGSSQVIVGATSNHVTDLGDIPKIIATRRGLKAEDVLVTFMDAVKIIDADGKRVGGPVTCTGCGTPANERDDHVVDGEVYCEACVDAMDDEGDLT